MTSHHSLCRSSDGSQHGYNRRTANLAHGISRTTLRICVARYRVDDYGASLQAIAGGKAPPPPEGARFDMSLEGSVDGPKLKGSWHGVE
jgi:hypothetical protein